MRTTILILTFVLVFFSAFAVKTITGDSNSSLDQYQLTQISENLYELSYSNSGTKFTIEVCNYKDECCYLLRSEKIELMYLCNEDGFGMRKMPEKLKKISSSVYKNLIDSKSFQQQSLLSSSRKDEKQALGLIACFFPDAINSDSFNVVFNTQKTVKGSELTSQK